MKLFDFLANQLAKSVTPNLKMGKNIFVAYMPAACKDGFLVTSNNLLYINHYTRVTDGSVQIMYRSGSPERSYEMALKASEILSGFNLGTLEDDGVRVIKSVPKSMPFVYPKGETGLYEASINLSVTCAFAKN